MRLLQIILLCLIAFSSYSQKLTGMVEVNDGFWVDDTEITNYEYNSFVKAQPIKKQAQYFPDTTVWEDAAMASYYFQHPAFDDYPVVGINYQQAKAFCQWRTSIYQEKYPQRKVVFRLPSLEEWERIATPEKTAKMSTFAGGWEGIYVIKKTKRRNLCNFNTALVKEGKPLDGIVYTNPVSYYAKDGKKIYGLSGNVAEMVEEQSNAKGGSWAHQAEACHIGEKLKYEKASAWLGFRCVAEINN